MMDEGTGFINHRHAPRRRRRRDRVKHAEPTRISSWPRRPDRE
jgi:hypothetical protein